MFEQLTGGGQKLQVWSGGKKKAPDCLSNAFFLWCHQESNRGHKDFQSFALPTELWHLSVFASAKVSQKSEPCKHFPKKNGRKGVFSCKKPCRVQFYSYLCTGFSRWASPSFSRQDRFETRFDLLLGYKENIRKVAQLVAYHVRDVGVGSSSLLFPTNLFNGKLVCDARHISARNEG